VRSNDYARNPVDHGAWLYACDDGEQVLIVQPTPCRITCSASNPTSREFSTSFKLPLMASLAGDASLYHRVHCHRTGGDRSRWRGAAVADPGKAFGNQ
jgi:hypothetical protein